MTKGVTDNLTVALAKFFRRACDVSWEGDDVDGGEVQDWGEELGLLIRETYDPDKHGVIDDAEPGDTIYTFSPEVRALLTEALHSPPPDPDPQ